MSITLKRSRTVVELCTDLSLAAEHERLTGELHAMRSGPKDDRENDPRTPLARQITELEHEMASSTLAFTLEALPRKRYAEIVEANHPREGDKNDESFGLNVSTGVDAIVTEPGVVVAVVNKATGEPVDFDPAEWSALADEMSNSQWEAFALAVIQLNQGRASAPFSAAASLVTRLSDEN